MWYTIYIYIFYTCSYIHYLSLCCLAVLAAPAVYSSINVSNYGHSLSLIWLRQGCRHPAHTFSPTTILACVGFLWLQPHLHPAAEAFLTQQIPPKTLQGSRINPDSVPMEWFCVLRSVSSVSFLLTKHNSCLFSFPSTVCVFVCVSPWVLVWLCFVETAVSPDTIGRENTSETCHTNRTRGLANVKSSRVEFMQIILEMYTESQQHMSFGWTCSIWNKRLYCHLVVVDAPESV